MTRRRREAPRASGLTESWDDMEYSDDSNDSKRPILDSDEEIGTPSVPPSTRRARSPIYSNKPYPQMVAQGLGFPRSPSPDAPSVVSVRDSPEVEELRRPVPRPAFRGPTPPPVAHFSPVAASSRVLRSHTHARPGFIAKDRGAEARLRAELGQFTRAFFAYKT